MEHCKLMAQHEDLGVLGHAVDLVDADRLCEAMDDAVEGERHRRRATPSSSCPVKTPDE